MITYKAAGLGAKVTPTETGPSSPEFGVWVRDRRLTAPHRAGFTGPGCRVAVIDTGCDIGHPY